jgi:molybdenum cofactor cytidylyltransferase
MQNQLPIPTAIATPITELVYNSAEMTSLTGVGIPFARALRLERGAVVSFVGGGGKTSSMFRLAAELSASGLRVVTTTTTHISEEQVRFSPASLNPENLASLAGCLDQFGQCLVVSSRDGKGRVLGVSFDQIEQIRARPDVDAILVEADGSRSRPFKAPGGHEPVVPESTNILVPIAGLNSIGAPLDEEHVHRSEIAAALSESEPGCRVTAEIVARVLSHPQGGAKSLPAGARLVPLLNRADAETDLPNAHEAAERLLARSSVDSVIIGSMVAENPIREMWTPVAGIILAAGESSCFSALKRMLEWKDTTMTVHCAQVALAAGLDPVVVVLGYEAEKIGEELAGLPVRIAINDEFAAGQSTSVLKGLETLPARTGAAVFLLADQPLITSAILRELVEVHRRTLAPACVPVFEGQRGNPVLFDRALFPELRRIRGDTGGGGLLDRYRNSIVTVPASREVLLDIDTPEDYQQFRP